MNKLLQRSLLAATLLTFLTPARTAEGTAPAQLVRVEERVFGQTPEGETVKLYTLRNANGMTAKIMSRGATITELSVPDREGRFANVVMGADTLDAYLSGYNAAASVIGRVANRIARAQFTLDGTEHQLAANSGKHHIHGGRRGFAQRVWESAVAVPARAAPVSGSRSGAATARRAIPATLMSRSPTPSPTTTSCGSTTPPRRTSPRWSTSPTTPISIWPATATCPDTRSGSRQTVTRWRMPT